MKNPNQQQQGDVWIERIDTLPANLTEKFDRHNVLADGEHTGHHHRLVAENLSNIRSFFNNTGEQFLVLDEDCTLVHEEHNSQVMSKGIYKFGQIHQYDYEKQESVPVFD